MQTLQDAEFPWHCSCGDQSPPSSSFAEVDERMPGSDQRCEPSREDAAPDPTLSSDAGGNSASVNDVARHTAGGIDVDRNSAGGSDAGRRRAGQLSDSCQLAGQLGNGRQLAGQLGACRSSTSHGHMGPDDAHLKAQIENALLRDQRMLKTFTQPKAVYDQMKDCGIRTFVAENDADSSSDIEFFESVD